jgi:hypothetical protein
MFQSKRMAVCLQGWLDSGLKETANKHPARSYLPIGVALQE